ncbi:MAG: XTP/dITP diphosphatase [Flexistipes sinusarabici]|uniref:dITP/XTP pyrophosphatase n=1 Tax=Flexistipes sinusarabici TaxID=2352 RepID=A0A5D0MUJ2_FLESI|nr:XTP/dITP diphosphatase [Flexistipes sinusarabici]TYB35807.1 MAG: XTP/dITP diphosphatase [Flexistipes sinusarabici]
MERLLVASKNNNKLNEIRKILGCLNIKVNSVYDFCSMSGDIEETGSSFEENASIKALAFSKLVEDFIIADDSGLCVDYLNGAPGVFSARFAGEDATDKQNNEKLLDKLRGVDSEQRKARFVCVIALAKKGEIVKTFRGECHGIIAENPRGEGGFGYDPLFLLENGNTMAEISAEEKNRISHRYNALEKLKKFIGNYQCED